MKKCPPGEYYNIELSDCYIPQHHTNVQALTDSGRALELQNYTLEALAAKIAKDKLPTEICPADKPMLSGKNCIACEAPSWYNLQTRDCYTPKKSANTESLQKNGNYIEDENATLADLKESIESDPYPTTPCPEAAPVLVDGQCHGCPQGDYYVLTNYTCYTPEKRTNTAFLRKARLAIEVDNFTLNNVEAEIENETLPTQPCPEIEPMWDGENCVACPEGSLYLLKNATCYKAKSVTNVNALNESGLYLEEGDFTLKNLNESLHSSGLPFAPCPYKAPIFNGSKCVKCPNNDYFILKNNTCYTPRKATNVTFLAASNQYVEDQNNTLADLNDTINNSYLPVEICPEDKPIAVYNGTDCAAIPAGQFYLLKDGSFYKPTNATNIDALEASKQYV